MSFKEAEIKLKQLDEIRRQIIERMNLEMKLAIEKKNIIRLKKYLLEQKEIMIRLMNLLIKYLHSLDSMI